MAIGRVDSSVKHNTHNMDVYIAHAPTSGCCCGASASHWWRLTKRKQAPGRTRPARPRRCCAAAWLTQHSCSRDRPRATSYLQESAQAPQQLVRVLPCHALHSILQPQYTLTDISSTHGCPSALKPGARYPLMMTSECMPWPVCALPHLLDSACVHNTCNVINGDGCFCSQAQHSDVSNLIFALCSWPASA